MSHPSLNLSHSAFGVPVQDQIFIANDKGWISMDVYYTMDKYGCVDELKTTRFKLGPP